MSSCDARLLAELGLPWLRLGTVPIYRPWPLFGWSYHYDAYASIVFDKAGMAARHLAGRQLDPARQRARDGPVGQADKVDFHTWTLLKGVAISTLLGVGANMTFSGESDLVLAP